MPLTRKEKADLVLSISSLLLAGIIAASAVKSLTSSSSSTAAHGFRFGDTLRPKGTEILDS